VSEEIVGTEQQTAEDHQAGGKQNTSVGQVQDRAPLTDSLISFNVGRPPKGRSNCRVCTVMENLEKSWNFKMVISRSGKVMEKT